MDLETLKLDYTQSLETYRQLADIRFKLLALVPTLTTAAVALLTKSPTIPRAEKAGLATLGFLATLGIVLYDQRNTQFYNGAIGRAQDLERRLGLKPAGGDREGGLFRSRREHPTRHILGLPVGHDLGLALIYSTTLGAWAFAAVLYGARTRAWLALLAGAAVTALFFIQFLWHDGKPQRVKAWLRCRVVERPIFVFSSNVLTVSHNDRSVIDALEAAKDRKVHRPCFDVRAYDANGRLLAIEKLPIGWTPLFRPEARKYRVVVAAKPRRARGVEALRDGLAAVLENSAAPPMDTKLLALTDLKEKALQHLQDRGESS